MIGEKLCYTASFISEALTVWIYLDYLFVRKKSTWVIAVWFALGYLVLTVISRFENTTLNATACFLVNCILIKQNYLCSIKATLQHAAFLCFVMTVSEVLVALMFGIVGLEFSSYTRNFYALVTLTVLSRMLNLVFSVVGSRVFAPNHNLNREPHFMILFCSLPILSAVIAIFTAYYGMTSGVSSETGLMMFITILTLLVVNLMFLALYNHVSKANEDYLTLQLSIQKEHADAVYYQALREQFENQRILIHDIKKHLGVIDALAQEKGIQEIESYISELHSIFAPISQAKLCNDPILNLLLLRFREDCMNNNITLYCDVRENVSVFMDATSITALYGNLFSNAIEAACISNEKQIELSVTRNSSQSVIVITINNSCDTPPIPDSNGRFHSHKKGQLSHGVGLKSIERVVQKFNGVATMYYDSKRKRFHHIIQFPIPDKEVAGSG